MSEDLNEELQKAVSAIDDYYGASFKLHPQRCTPFLVAFIEHAEKIVLGLTPNQRKRLQEYLHKTVLAMEEEDHVLVRDYLQYEIRPLLLGLRGNKRKGNLLQ